MEPMTDIGLLNTLVFSMTGIPGQMGLLLYLV